MARLVLIVLMGVMALVSKGRASSHIWRGESMKDVARLLCWETAFCGSKNSEKSSLSKVMAPVFEFQWSGGGRRYWLFEAARALEGDEQAWEFAIVEILESGKDVVCTIWIRAYVENERPNPFVDPTPMSDKISCEAWLLDNQDGDAVGSKSE